MAIPESEMNVLFEWHDIGPFSLAVERLDAKVESSQLFSDPKLQPLMEALILRDFCRTMDYHRCHLTRHFPDAQLEKLGGETLSLEITEAMTPGRRRGEEYKNGADDRSFPDADEIGLIHENWQEWVLSRIKSKLFKRHRGRQFPRYDTACDFDLIIYVDVNFPRELDNLDRLHKSVSNAVSQTRLARNAVWLYRYTEIFQIYPSVSSHPIPGGLSRF